MLHLYGVGRLVGWVVGGMVGDGAGVLHLHRVGLGP